MECSHSIKIVIGKTVIIYSKRVLMKHSDYFKAMFSGSFSESEKNEVNLSDIKVSIFKTILGYLEGKSLGLSSSNVFSIIKAATMYQFTGVLQECEDFVIKSFTILNCYKLQQDSSLYGAPNLSKAAFSFRLWNFSHFVEQPSLLNGIPFNELVNYLGSENLNIADLEERKILDVLLFYINSHKKYLTQGQIQSLLKLVHYSRLLSSEISSILVHPVVHADSSIVKLLKTVCSIKDGENIEDNDEEHSNYLEVQELLAKLPRKIEYVPCIIGSKCVKIAGKYHSSYVVYAYNYQNSATVKGDPSLVKEVMTMLDAIDMSCVGFSVTADGSCLYITGGKLGLKSNTWNEKVWVYDTTVRQLRVLTKIRRCRRHHRSFVLNGILYLIAGFGSFRDKLTSVDAFSILKGEWIDCHRPEATMNGGAPCFHQENIYVFVDNIICIFTPSENDWNYHDLNLQPAISFRHAFSWGNFIYLIEKFSTNVYIYSPSTKKFRKYGQFRNITINVSQCESNLFCFTDDISTNSQVIEVIDLSSISYTPDLSSILTDNKTLNEENEMNTKNLVRSRIIWSHSQINGRKFITTDEHCYGSLKLHVPY